MFSIEIHTANLQTDDILDRPTTDRTQVETAMFSTNGEWTQQRAHGVGEVCLPFYDRNKAKYTFNLQRILYLPSFKFHLISVSHIVKQGNTVIFNQNNPHICVGQQKTYFIGREGLFFV